MVLWVFLGENNSANLLGGCVFVGPNHVGPYVLWVTVSSGIELVGDDSGRENG